MSERQKVACFFTGGFTEVNAMKLFLRKINSNIDFIQLCPTGTRRSKSDIQNRHIDNIDTKHSGLTGGALIEHIFAFIQRKEFQEEEYRAILIEDDKDDRFLDIQETGDAKCNKAAWEKFFEGRENYPIISYSKRKHGEVMLQQIEPDKVLNKCSVYFKEGCIELAKLDI